jgi:Fe-S cluster assembly scaffold protein SufB
VNVEEPIVVLNVSNSTASFSRTQIELGRGASATSSNTSKGAPTPSSCRSVSTSLDDNASLQLITYQRLDQSAWHVARTTGFVSRDARLRQAVVGIGAHYNRSRNDAEMRGAGSENELRTTFLGSGDQVHDFRTHQMHTGARSRSTLLSKGAVADQSRSVYTGLIEIEKGAKRTDARQTNHNLLLSPTAHADSVPNLDIRENDVMCAHASSVGPLDELQRWYLESRGVSRDDGAPDDPGLLLRDARQRCRADLAEVVERDVTSKHSAKWRRGDPVTTFDIGTTERLRTRRATSIKRRATAFSWWCASTSRRLRLGRPMQSRGFSASPKAK